MGFASDYPYGQGVAGRPDGGFVVTWATGFFSSPVLARRFDAAGAPLGRGSPLWPPPNGYPSVAADTDGNYVVVWEDGCAHFRRYDATGEPLGDAVEVQGFGGPASCFYHHRRRHPALAGDAAGNFVIAFSSDPGETYQLSAHRFDADRRCRAGR